MLIELQIINLIFVAWFTDYKSNTWFTKYKILKYREIGIYVSIFPFVFSQKMWQ